MVHDVHWCYRKSVCGLNVCCMEMKEERGGWGGGGGGDE